ncbi:MAG: B12-binding domain-containing radical SAM protein [Spirochaetota bacterium]
MKKKSFLLVYPEIPDTYWSYKYALPFIGKRALMPPLGLATIAAMIPGDHEIRIVDLNVEPLHDRDLLRADLVLASAMIVQRRSLTRLIRRCRCANRPIVVGGPYATESPALLADADFLVLGEGETTFPTFLSDWLAGAARRVYECRDRPAMETSPIPRFDLLSMQWYDTIPLQFSRGCPFDCEFCDIVRLFGHTPRTKPPEQFLREMTAAHATGFRGSLFVVDDNFIANRRAVKTLLREIIRWQRDHGYPFRLCTEASIDLADDAELLVLMAEAGFSMVFVGIESPIAESLRSSGKRQNLRRDVAASVRTIQEQGIEVTGGFIIGFDSDPPEVFDLQSDFIQELAIPTAMVGLLMALPGTRLYERLEAEGRILSASNGNNTHAAELNFVPRLPREVLESGYRRVLGTIYRPRRYFDRCLELLRRYPRRSRHGGRDPIAFREVTGFVRSVVRQTLSGYGAAYLRYLILGITRRPDLIVKVVTLAVEGHHYFKMTRHTLRLARVRQRRRARTARRSSGAFGRIEPDGVATGGAM